MNLFDMVPNSNSSVKKARYLESRHILPNIYVCRSKYFYIGRFMQDVGPHYMTGFLVWSYVFYGYIRIGKLEVPLLPYENTNILGFDIPPTEGVFPVFVFCAASSRSRSFKVT